MEPQSRTYEHYVKRSVNFLLLASTEVCNSTSVTFYYDKDDRFEATFIRQSPEQLETLHKCLYYKKIRPGDKLPTTIGIYDEVIGHISDLGYEITLYSERSGDGFGFTLDHPFVGTIEGYFLLKLCY